jgi:hypothetical protein
MAGVNPFVARVRGFVVQLRRLQERVLHLEEGQGVPDPELAVGEAAQRHALLAWCDRYRQVE